MLRKQNGRTVALLFALVALSGDVQRRAGAMAPQTAASEVAPPAAAPAEAPPAERKLTLPSGATLKVATDWTVTKSKDGLTLEDPEKQLKVELVEVDASAGIRRTLEVIYDGRPEAEEDLRSDVREVKAYLTGQQKDWRVPPDPAEVKRLAGSYRNAARGDLVVHPGKDEVVFQFGGWKSRMATKVNPDGTTSFVSIEPGVRGFEFNAPAAKAAYTRLTLRDPQHTYEYEAVSPTER